MKRFVTLLLTWSLVLLSWAGTADAGSKSVDVLIEELYSRDPALVARAGAELTSLAGQSPESRASVVSRLLAVLDDPRTESVAFSNAWYASAEILGNLKASRAIEALVRHLDYTNGVAGLSSAHLPAVRALVKIGKPAVSALSVALSDARPAIRANAARALGAIGGEEAVAYLESAYKTETNSNVKGEIGGALQVARDKAP